jgi:hypothetical protein
MGIRAKLTQTIECEDCRKTEAQTIQGTWFNNRIADLSEEEMNFTDFIESLEMQGWKFIRSSYEQLEPYCPSCKKSL